MYVEFAAAVHTNLLFYLFSSAYQMVKKLIITRWCRQKSKLLPLAIRRHWEQKPPFCIHLGFHLLSASLQFPADCKLLRSLEKPPTAIWRSMIIWSFLGVPNPLLHLFFSPKPHSLLFLLNGSSVPRTPLKPGVTYVLSQARPGPLSAAVDKKSHGKCCLPLFLTPPHPRSSLLHHLSPHCG